MRLIVKDEYINQLKKLKFLVLDHENNEGHKIYRMIRGHLHGFLVMSENDAQIDLDDYIKEAIKQEESTQDE